MLYTVRFTTRSYVSRYNAAGKLIERVLTEVPVVHHLLPHSAALAFSHCDNFEMVPSERDYSPTRHGPSPKQHWSVGVAPRKRGRPPKAASANNLHEAASSGDLSAAINGVDA